MTTAHRPTWHNAIGGEGHGGTKLFATIAVSAHDQPGHKALKVRRKGQAAPEELSKKDFKKDLREKERKRKLNKTGLSVGDLEAFTDVSVLTSLPDTIENPFPEDADDEPNVAIADSDDESEDEDEAELLRELEKIKKEREEEEKKKRVEEEQQAREQQRERILRGNPLLMGSGGEDAILKRRWDDDVIFKNQAKGIAKTKKTYINDTVRSEFHKKFLSKYIV